jgi:pimeloyl-ACP methyl ester carboxylesterase
MVDRLAAIRIGETLCLGDVRDRESLEFSARCLLDVDPRVFEPLVSGQWLRGFEPADLWSHVACPVLLLQGDPTAGGTFRDDDLSLACRDLRSAKHIQFPATGHQIHRERPAEMLAELRRWRRDQAPDH